MSDRQAEHHLANCVRLGRAFVKHCLRRRRKRVAALRQTGAEIEYHKFAGLGPRFGLGIAEGWTAHVTRFWKKHPKFVVVPSPNVRTSASPL